MKGRMSSSGGNVQVSDAVFELDDLKGSGGITVTFGVPLAIVAQVSLDTLDLDSYMAAPGGGQPKPAGGGDGRRRHPPIGAVGPSIGLKAKVAKLIWHKETIGGVDVDVALQGSTLRLNDVKVANLRRRAAGRARHRGRLRCRAASARYRLQLRGARHGSRAEARRGHGADGPRRGDGEGGVAGTLEQVTLREFALTAAGQSVQATARWPCRAPPQGPPTVGVLQGQRGAERPGARRHGRGEARRRGPGHCRPQGDVLDLDKIGGGARRRRGAGAPGAATSAAARRSTPAPLRSFDGSFKLTAGNLVDGRCASANADLAATLKDGVLTIAHFKGAIYGGTLGSAGVVDAQPAGARDRSQGRRHGTSISARCCAASPAPTSSAAPSRSRSTAG